MELVHEDDLRRDAELFGIVEPVFGDLRKLSPKQIELLVFFLKGLHGYYPGGEKSWDNWSKFEDKLKVIRESKEQVALQRNASMNLLWTMLASAVAGMVAFIGIVLLVAGSTPWGSGLLVLALGIALLTEAKWGKAALVLAKEQDRRYFLDSIRAARSCNELDWCGLFSYNGVSRPGSQSDEDIARTERRVAELAAQLRSAVYNDEFFCCFHR